MSMKCVVGRSEWATCERVQAAATVLCAGVEWTKPEERAGMSTPLKLPY